MTHHRSNHHLHVTRLLLGSLLILATLIARTNWSLAVPAATVASHPQGSVLAYATGISSSELLGETNTNRSSNGLPLLTINSQLNASAQAKAQHMIDGDYWAHVAPDGTQPWYFFQQAGYQYQIAGENLAYGFFTSSGVVTAWMNSPTHRDNVLGDYYDVGFGVANGSNYQGGEYTIVVAHYGKPSGAPSAPQVASPVPSPSPSTSAAPSVALSPVASPVATPAPQATTDSSGEPAPAPTSSPQPSSTPYTSPSPSTAPVSTPAPQTINALQGMRVGVIPPVIGVSLSITTIAGLAFAATHRALMKHALLAGQHFALAHPAFDIIAVASAIVLILSTTVARI